MTLIKQERGDRLETLIKQYITSELPVLIYCGHASELIRVKYSNVYIAPDSEGTDYASKVSAIVSEQNQIYYPLYLKFMRVLKRLQSRFLHTSDIVFEPFAN